MRQKTPENDIADADIAFQRCADPTSSTKRQQVAESSQDDADSYEEDRRELLLREHISRLVPTTW